MNANDTLYNLLQGTAPRDIEVDKNVLIDYDVSNSGDHQGVINLNSVWNDRMAVYRPEEDRFDSSVQTEGDYDRTCWLKMLTRFTTAVAALTR